MAKKVVVELPDDVYKALRELASEEKQDPADTLAKAILTSRFLARKKGKLLVEDEDGTISEVLLK